MNCQRASVLNPRSGWPSSRDQSKNDFSTAGDDIGSWGYQLVGSRYIRQSLVKILFLRAKVISLEQKCPRLMQKCPNLRQNCPYFFGRYVHVSFVFIYILASVAKIFLFPTIPPAYSRRTAHIGVRVRRITLPAPTTRNLTVVFPPSFVFMNIPGCTFIFAFHFTSSLPTLLIPSMLLRGYRDLLMCASGG